MLELPFPFQILIPLANISFIHFPGDFPILRKISFPDLYLLIRPPGRPLAIGRGTILIPGFIRLNHKLANDMKMWKGNGNTTTLLFSLKRLDILYQERRGHVRTIVMEQFNGILFHKSEPANKQYAINE